MGAGNYLHHTYGYACQFMVTLPNTDDEIEVENSFYDLLDDLREAAPDSCRTFKVNEEAWHGQCRLVAQNNSYKVMVTDNANDDIVVIFETHSEEGQHGHTVHKNHALKAYKRFAKALLKNLYSLSVRRGPWMSANLTVEDLE